MHPLREPRTLCMDRSVQIAWSEGAGSHSTWKAPVAVACALCPLEPLRWAYSVYVFESGMSSLRWQIHHVGDQIGLKHQKTTRQSCMGVLVDSNSRCGWPSTHRAGLDSVHQAHTGLLSLWVYTLWVLPILLLPIWSWSFSCLKCCIERASSRFLASSSSFS